MATDLGRAKSAPTNKYDAFVAAQLARVESRIRLLDLATSLLGLLALSLVYVVGMVLCDSKWMLAQQTRQFGLFLFLAGSAIYLFFMVVRPLRLRINPYFAARQVEQHLPYAKNSIVNWVDLHERQLMPAIQGALGQRAAKDLARVDLDRAISGRRAAWMGGFAGFFGLVFLASFFLLGPLPFYSLLKRTFNPFGGASVSTRTQLSLRKPEGGHALVTVGRGLTFVVDVHGKVPRSKAPDAVKLLYRYEEGDPWLERPLIEEPSREWTTSMSPLEIRNGFWYRITGGDAATEEYQVGVRAAPAITDFLATYHFRPYVARADEVRRDRELKELRGTEVRLRVRTNRNLRDGRLEFVGKEGSRTVRAEIDPRDPSTLWIAFTLEEDGKYRLFFTSTESEAYSDPSAYDVVAIPDHPPVVELTRPGQNIRLPADGLLELEGKASDDLGIQSLTLRMQVVGGDRLRSQPYRGDEALRLADGGNPLELEYQDFVDLARVQAEDGSPIRLRAGMELEYWLEARDACDYPRPNVAESKHYRVMLTEPEKNETKRQQETRQAEQNKKQHDQKQDQQLKQENQKRQQERQQQQARNQEEENRSKEAEKAGADGSSPSKDKGQANTGEKEGQKDESSSGASGQENGEQRDGSEKGEQSIEERIKKALGQKEAAENAKGEGKPDPGNTSEGKEGQSNKSENNGASQSKPGNDSTKDAGESQPGDAKSNPKPGDRGEAADKDPAKQKGSSEGNDKPDNASASRPEKEKGGAEANKSEEGANSGNNAPANQGKPGGDSQDRKDSAQGKAQSTGQSQERPGGQGNPNTDKDRQGKQGSSSETQGTPAPRHGEAKQPNKGEDSSKSEGKQGSSAAKSKPSDAADAKPSSAQDKSEKTARSESKPDPETQAREATAKEIQDLARALESKNAQEREKAKQQLQRIEKQAADEKARAKASEALDKLGEAKGNDEDRKPKDASKPFEEPKKQGQDAGRRDPTTQEQQGSATGEKRPDDSSSSANKPSRENKPSPSQSSSSAERKPMSGTNEEKGSPVEPESEKHAGTPASAKGDPSAEKNDKNQGSPDKNDSNGKKEQTRSENRDAQGPDASQGGKQAGGGGERRAGQSDAGDTGEGLSPEGKPAQPRSHRAAQMQLEYFAKKVNKDILKEAGISEEAWKRYLESKRKQLQQGEKARPDTPAVPQQANRLPSMGGRTIEPSASGQGDAQGPDRGQPPPGYRDSYREFTRQLSKGK